MLGSQRQQKLIVLCARFKGADLRISITQEPGSGVEQTKWAFVKLNVDGFSNITFYFGGTNI
jgi:hypothetical protein